ncbi:MAG TPA: thiazole biosynthesis adenylyltransferase ThiF, partial [Terriglobia bacterium]|nr:thiazole biosynthesis adenylyltransferase ThiF [Terriglobia bacterium]
HNRTQQVRPKRDPDCRTCGQRMFTYLEEGEPLPTTLCGRDAVQIRHRDSRKLDMGLLKARLEQFGTVRANDFLLKFSFDGYELTVFADGRAIIKGTQDPAVARGLYAKYIST